MEKKPPKPVRMIDKPSILIASLGRNGTEFFVRLFTGIMPDATCLHEPDLFVHKGVDNRLKHYLLQLRRASIWRMFFLKAAGKWTLATVSDAKFLGRISADQALRELVRQRQGLIDELPGSVYMEANLGYYGLLDIAPRAFSEHRAVYLVRDGRDWIRSHMNWGEVYGKRGLRKLISHKWPTPIAVEDDLYAEEWPRWSPFQRLCWAWSRLNAYALKSLSRNSRARLYRFEQVFSGDHRYQVLNELVDFATSLPGIDRKRLGRTDGWLERKFHQSTGDFPGWSEWTIAQREHFRRVCGPLMTKLGYQFD